MSPTQARTVAVLGGGIMGCATALFLARRGITTAIYDQAATLMSGASRWNEGKIHLGFLYAADRSLGTARRLIEGGLAFRELVEELVEEPLGGAVTPDRDIYLVHPDSVVSAAETADYHTTIGTLLNDAPGCYVGPRNTVEPVEPLRPDETRALTGGLCDAGFRVPERSIDTLWLADRFVAAVDAEPAIMIRTSFPVSTVTRQDSSRGVRWTVSGPSDDGPYDAVVNAFWEGRIAVDRGVGMEAEPGWSHRYRLSLFVETDEPLDLPSAVLATGPFGDIKNYGRGRFYLSWYPAGLIAEGSAVEPPPLPAVDTHEIIGRIGDDLRAHFPWSREILERARKVRVGGGWVFANGRGLLSDRQASIHRRDRFGIRRSETYFSVDTGKYSMAPLLAQRLAETIAESLRSSG